LQTDPPHWLAEAYAAAICVLDTGAIARNQITSRLTGRVANLLGLSAADRGLDLGGGHGVLTRMLRDAGWNFFWSDKYAENLFARGFEGPCEPGYALFTAFEVAEHLSDVRDEWTRWFACRPRALLIGTELRDRRGEDWYYYLPEIGQHVAFYSAETMRYIGRLFDYQVLTSSNYCLYLRSDLRLSIAQRVLLRGLFARNRLWRTCCSTLTAHSRGPSRAWADYCELRERLERQTPRQTRASALST